jgi:cytochrome c oxidase subunit 4
MFEMELEKEKSLNKEETHYHPPYVTIYFILVILTFASIFISQIVHRKHVPPFVFAISTIKALIIALFYMHLKYENRWVIALALIPLIIFTIILFVFMPDILNSIKM